MTLATPMPLNVFEEERAAGRIPGAVRSVTLYFELPSGYPFQVSGAPTEDLSGNLAAFMGAVAARQNESRPNRATPAGASVETSETSDEVPSAAELENAGATVRDLSVVLGFTLAPSDYEREAATLHGRYPIAGVEITAGAGTPFKVPDDRIDAARVSQWREVYRRNA